MARRAAVGSGALRYAQASPGAAGNGKAGSLKAKQGSNPLFLGDDRPKLMS